MILLMIGSSCSTTSKMKRVEHKTFNQKESKAAKQDRKDNPSYKVKMPKRK